MVPRNCPADDQRPNLVLCSSLPSGSVRSSVGERISDCQSSGRSALDHGGNSALINTSRTLCDRACKTSGEFIRLTRGVDFRTNAATCLPTKPCPSRSKSLPCHAGQCQRRSLVDSDHHEGYEGSGRQGLGAILLCGRDPVELRI